MEKGRPDPGKIYYACKRNMTEAELKEENTKKNRAAWRNKIISYTGDPRLTAQARDEEYIMFLLIVQSS